VPSYAGLAASLTVGAACFEATISGRKRLYFTFYYLTKFIFFIFIYDLIFIITVFKRKQKL
jgi:hypothetical protein